MSKCPHCGSILGIESDGYENYLACFGCTREFDFNMMPRRMSPLEFFTHYGIKLTVPRERAKMRIE